jgi:amino acid transporter
VFSAVPALRPHAVALCLVLIAFLTLANLRGVRPSGALFALATYSFLVSMFLMIGMGLFRLATGGVPQTPPGAFTVEQATGAMLREQSTGVGVLEAVSLFAILRAFTSGCTALTGIEAIPDGVPAFRRPEARNAAATLMATIVILTTLFLGMSYLAHRFVLPAIPETAPGYETVISQIGRRVFAGPLSWYYYVLMAASAAILVVAANTAYAGFPRLASLLARDKFLPSQLANLGDRLVFQNGILILAVAASLLVIAFRGSVTSLLPLYAVGVFTSFTLSQSSMVRKWLRDRGPGWLPSMGMNLLGAISTGLVLVVIALTKFNAGDPTGLRVFGTDIHYGAWVVIALVPLLVLAFRKINRHYADVARHLVPDAYPSLLQENHPPAIHHTVLVLVPGIHKGSSRPSNTPARCPTTPARSTSRWTRKKRRRCARSGSGTCPASR